ncbi:hypothetical protein [Paenibacillus selenitireducens]|nr:hypothetical protein [Paenibacillus selenitireducens]
MIKASIRICALSILVFALTSGGSLSEVQAKSSVQPSVQHKQQV